MILKGRKAQVVGRLGYFGLARLGPEVQRPPGYNSNAYYEEGLLGSFITNLVKVITPQSVAILGSVGLAALAGSLAFARTQRPLEINLANQSSVLVKGPLRVDFSQDVANGYSAQIHPEIAGKWQPEPTPLGISATSFTPDKRFEAGRTYSLKIRGLKRGLTGIRLPDFEQSFTIQVAPEVKDFYPLAAAQNVSIKPQFSLTLAEANNSIRELEASLEPAVELKLVSSDDRTFIWEPVSALKQDATYTFMVDDGHATSAQKRLVTSTFTTVKQPKIMSARSGSLFGPSDTIDVVFDQPMQASQSVLVGNFEGSGNWIKPHTYRYTPRGLKPGTAYSYQVKAGLTSESGGVVETDQSFQFSTNGAVTAIISPSGTVAVNTPVRVAFDQPVDHQAAQDRFKISPQLSGKFSWVGNTMIFTPSGSAYQTAYDFSVGTGVTPVWGLPSNRVMSGAYTTETQVIKLGIPVYKQTYGRSCEITSLRMLLAFRGINVSELDILSRIGYAPRERNQAANEWENPNQMFVGFIDTFSWTRGYGVHAGPIAAAGQSYGRNATAHFGITASFIAGHIHAGRPVAVWGHLSPAQADAWNTGTGVIQTTTSMHSRVVYGVAGRADAPVGFYIHDPWTGGSFYWSVSQLMANMNVVPGVSNQAVVVY
jgi:uncharacterized protein YvpB